MKARFVSFVTLLLLVITPLPVAAQTLPSPADASLTMANVAAGVFKTGGLLPPCLRTGAAAQSADLSCVTQSITYYIYLLLILIALGAFFFVLYGAFLYVSAFGDEAKTKQAKKVITNAAIGIVIAMLAGFIVQLVRTTLKA